MPSLPVLIAIGWGLTLVFGAGGTLWYRDQLHSLQAADAKADALAKQKIIDAKAADAQKTQALAELTSQIKQAIQDTRDESKAAFAKVASNPACGNTAAAQLFDSRMRTVSKPPGSRP